MLWCPRSSFSLQLGPRVLMYNLFEIEIDFVYILKTNYFVSYWQTVAINVFLCFLIIFACVRGRTKGTPPGKKPYISIGTTWQHAAAIWEVILFYPAEWLVYKTISYDYRLEIERVFATAHPHSRISRRNFIFELLFSSADAADEKSAFTFASYFECY